MKKIKLFLAVSVLLMSLCSCATNSRTEVEPVNSGDALLVGRIIFDVRHSYINGMHKKGIQLEVVDMNSHDSFTLYTDSEGLFFMPAVPGHKYRLFSLYYTRNNGDGSWMSDNLFYDFEPVIKAGAVNIVCDMLVEVEYDDWIKTPRTDTFNEVMSAFEKNYKGSKWLEYQMN